MNAEASTSRSRKASLSRRSRSGSSAKGKERADDVAEQLAPTGLIFNVRFTDGATEDVLALWVGEREAVRDVKRRIRLIRPATLASRRLRLIYLGRILTDGVLLVPWTAALLERQKQYEAGQNRLLDDALVSLEGVVKSVTASATDDGDGKGKGKATGKGGRLEEQKPIWLNCSVGEVEEPEAPAVAETEQAPQIEPLRGFDRLRDAGFSEDDIQQVREQFHEDRGVDPAAEDEHARAIEDQWLEGAQGEPGHDPSAPGSYTTLLYGATIGFAVPLLPFFFFRSDIFSKRLQMAILLGVAINMAFALLSFFS